MGRVHSKQRQLLAADPWIHIGAMLPHCHCRYFTISWATVLIFSVGVGMLL